MRDYRTGSGRTDWNERAREDYRHAILSTTEGDADEEAFRASGKVEVQELLALLKGRDTSGWRALEYGCGVGRVMVPFSEHLAEICGIDISDEMARIGRERNAGREDLGFWVLEDGKLPFPDASFDLVYSVHVFQHMPRKAFAEIVPELALVLRPNGLFAFQLTLPYTLRRRVQALLSADGLSWRRLFRSRDGAPETFRRRYYLRRQIYRLLRGSGLRMISSRLSDSFAHHIYYLAELREDRRA